MTRKQIEKFAVGYPVPTDWVEILLDYYNGDTNKVHLILPNSAVKPLALAMGI